MYTGHREKRNFRAFSKNRIQTPANSDVYEKIERKKYLFTPVELPISKILQKCSIGNVDNILKVLLAAP